MDINLKGLKKVPKWALYAAAAGVALYVIKKGSLQNAVAGVTAGAVSSAGDVVTGVGTGAVLGIGDIIGIERTDLDRCKDAIRKQETYNASKYCSAGVFARWQYLSVRKSVTGKTFTLDEVFNF